MALLSRLTVRVLEEDLSVDTTRTDQSRVESVDLVGSHDDLDVTAVVEAVQLVEQLQHSSLNFALSS
jgi:hypothetical protein